MDETGFRIECLEARVVITHVSTRVVYLVDLDIRGWVIVIKTISTSGKAIPAILILSSSIMLQKHFENDLDNDTLFAIT